MPRQWVKAESCNAARCCNPLHARERRKCSSFPPTFLSRSARGEEAAAEDIVSTCINGMQFSHLFQNSTGPLCYAGSAATRHPAFIMGFTPARDARWVPADHLSITPRFFGYRLFKILTLRFKSKMLTESNLAWAIGHAFSHQAISICKFVPVLSNRFYFTSTDS